MEKTIQITVNNQPKTIAVNTSVEAVLQQLKVATNGIAIAVNQAVVPQNNWENTVVNHNDTVLIIQATQGG